MTRFCDGLRISLRLKFCSVTIRTPRQVTSAVGYGWIPTSLDRSTPGARDDAMTRIADLTPLTPTGLSMVSWHNRSSRLPSNLAPCYDPHVFHLVIRETSMSDPSGSRTVHGPNGAYYGSAAIQLHRK